MKMLFCVGLFLSGATAIAGGEVGNGGQDVALDFANHGLNAVGIIQANFFDGAPVCKDAVFGDLCTLEIERVRNAARFAKVLSLPQVTQTEPETGRVLTYVALNFPQDQRILVSESEWKKPELCYVRKLPLALHEYLGLLGVEIQNYRYSSVLMEWLISTAPKDRFEGCSELNPKGD